MARYRSSTAKMLIIVVCFIGYLTLHYTSRSSRINNLRSQNSRGVTQFFSKDQSDESFSKVRVFCAVTTLPRDINTKAAAVKDTWGKRCDKLVFMSSEDNATLPAVKLNVTEGRRSLYLKSRETMIYLYNHHLYDAEWFLKADDDVFYIMENLRKFLKDKNSTEPVFFGRRLKRFIQQGYMSGGAGYILSREALKRVVEMSFSKENMCPTVELGNEDIYIGGCLASAGVKAGDTRDEKERQRFHPLRPEHALIPGLIGNTSWYWFYNFYEPRVGTRYVSPTSISFHYILPNDMRALEFLIYNMEIARLPSPV